MFPLCYVNHAESGISPLVLTIALTQSSASDLQTDFMLPQPRVMSVFVH